MTGAGTVNIFAANQAWDGAPPDWIAALAAECDRGGSQSRVADELGYSPAVISQVIRNRYPGDLARIEQLVRGRYLGKTVTCPVLEEIPRHACLRHQAVKLDAVSTNPFRVELYRACRAGCPHSLIRERPGRKGATHAE
jgi:DNA-binding transcriptional regulator YdaS (Cro superfamily)